MKNFIGLLLIAVVTSGLMGCANHVPIYNVNQHLMPFEAKKMSSQEIGRRICEAVAKRGWRCDSTTPQTLICHLEKRAHKAIVQIDYNTCFFSINYIDTCNLNYEAGEVHRNYNSWIKKMENDIVNAIGCKDCCNEK
ncbi:MAG: hypothetical protein KA112_00135 [Alphaproteobacteria bacterium]|jgi:hypothetical protein|nr:hypothetical protein [Alphaproteobacteria bacterium]MBP7729011.1 hypothetical protein [Alphaproteobacteria bacterium]